jgi:hypothetical protein
MHQWVGRVEKARPGWMGIDRPRDVAFSRQTATGGNTPAGDVAITNPITSVVIGLVTDRRPDQASYVKDSVKSEVLA